ncbi:hypothetical protein M5K25_018956 [Dendrobium thyrsiflorum]|uniref:Uncharacterized protein n=1 Tax=Dendrobium thyrsiflorum TaxID=117978 RepID=A0ABD0UDM2_DENTH
MAVGRRLPTMAEVESGGNGRQQRTAVTTAITENVQDLGNIFPNPSPPSPHPPAGPFSLFRRFPSPNRPPLFSTPSCLSKPAKPSCMGDPDLDAGFVFDGQGRTDILASPFFDIHFGFDETVDDYVDRILYQLTLSLEVHIQPGRWIIDSRPPPPPPPPPASSPADTILRTTCLTVISRPTRKNPKRKLMKGSILFSRRQKGKEPTSEQFNIAVRAADGESLIRNVGIEGSDHVLIGEFFKLKFPAAEALLQPNVAATTPGFHYYVSVIQL